MAFGAKIKLTADTSKGAAFRKEIQAFVDKSTSSNPIKLKNIEISLSKTKVDSLTKSLKSQLKNSKLELTIDKINADPAINTLKKQLNSMLSGLSIHGLGEFINAGGDVDQFKNIVNGAKNGKDAVKALNDEIWKMNAPKKDIDALSKSLISLIKLNGSLGEKNGGTGSSVYADANAKISEVKALVEDYLKNGTAISNRQLDTYAKQIEVQKIAVQQEIEKLNIFKKQTEELNKQSKAQEAANVVTEKDLSRVEKSLAQYKTSIIRAGTVDNLKGTAEYESLIGYLDKLYGDFEKINIEDGLIAKDKLELLEKEIIAQKELLSQQIVTLNVAKQETKETERQAKAEDTLYKRANSLYNQIKRSAIANSSSYFSNRETYDNWFTSLDDVMAGNGSERELKSKLAKVVEEYDGLKTQLKATNQEGKTLWDTLRSGWSKFGGWSLVTKSLMSVWRVVKDVKNAVVELDSAMTELKKVTDLTTESYKQYVKEASQIAQNRGAALTDVVNATADFARLGFNLDLSTQMAEAAIVYKNVGDGIDDISTASQSLISTIKAFGEQTYSAMEIVDKFNKVGNEFAISSAGIGTALQKSASALAAGGNSLEESIALATGMNAVVQNPEIVGTALKTYSMYLRAAKSEAEEAGESTEGMANSVSELRNEILKLTSGKVDIMIDDSNFKSTYQITKELAAVWKEISDIDQAAIIEQIGGKRNATAITSLITNFSDVEGALESASNAAGSATAENEKYLDSINGKLDILSAKFETVSNQLLNSGVVKFLVDLGNVTLDVLGAFTQNAFGIGLTVAALEGLVVTIKAMKTTAPLVKSIANQLINVNNAVAKGVMSDKEQLAVYAHLRDSLSVYNEKQKEKLLVAIQNRIAAQGNVKITKEQIATDLGITAANGTLASSNKIVAASFKEVQASIPGYGWAALIISTLLSIAVSLPWDEWVKSVEDIKAAADEAKTAIKDLKSDMENLQTSTKDVGQEFARLAQGVKNLGQANQSQGTLNSDDYERFLDLSNQLAELYPTLTKGYDENGNAILNLTGDVNTITGALTNLLNVQRQIVNQQILEKMGDVWAGYKVDTDEYDNKIKDLKEYQEEIAKLSSQIADGETYFKWVSSAKAREVINKVLDNIGYEPSLFSPVKVFESLVSGIYDLGNLSEVQFEQFKQELNRLSSSYQDEINLQKNNLKAANAELSSYINTWLSSDWNFVNLDTSLQNTVKEVLINFDWTEAIPDDVNPRDWEAVSGWLSSRFLYSIQNIKSEDLQNELKKSLEDSVSIEDLQSIIAQLKKLEGFDENNPLVFYLQAKIDDKKELIELVKAKVKDEYKNKVEELNDDDLKYAAEISITDGSLLSWTELQREIEKTKDKLNEAGKTIRDLTEYFDTLYEAIDKTLDKQEKLAEAFKKTRIGATLTIQEIYDLIKEMPSIAQYVSKVGDGYTISDEGFEAISKDNNEALKKQITQQLKEVRNDIDLLEQKEKLFAERERLKGLVAETNWQDKELVAQLDKVADEYIEVSKECKGVSETYESLIDTEKNLVIFNDLVTNSFEETGLALKGINEIFEEIKSEVSGYNSTISTIDNAIQKLKSGALLTYEEMNSIVQISSELQDSFEEPEFGYYDIKIEALEKLREESYKVRNDYIEDRIAEVNADIKAAEEAKKAYEDEISALMSAGSALINATHIESLEGDIDVINEQLNSLYDVLEKLQGLQGNIAPESKENDDLSDKLQNQIDYYKTILSAAEAVKDKYAEAVNKEIDALKNSKDILKDSNDERQRELDLIEARNNLENAKKRRVYVYKEGEGFKQVQDEGAVKKAEEEYRDAITEIQTAEIEKKIESLEETLEQLDGSIKELTDLEGNIDNAKIIAQAMKALGLIDQSELLNLPQETIEAIKTGLSEAIIQKEKEENKDNDYYQEITMEDFLKELGAKIDANSLPNLLSGDSTYGTAVQSFVESLKEQANNAVSSVVNNGGTNVMNTFNIYDATDPEKVAKVVNQEITNLFTKVNNSIK